MMKQLSSKAGLLLALGLLLLFIMESGYSSDFDVPLSITPQRVTIFIQGYPVKLSMLNGSVETNQLPAPIAAELRTRLEFRNRNLPMLRKFAQSSSALIDRGVVFKEEWNNSLQEVLLSIHPSDVSLPSPLHRHRPVLAVLPTYTRLNIVVPESLSQAVANELSELSLSNRASLIQTPVLSVRENGVDVINAPTRWAQDYGELSYSSKGNTLFFAPPSRFQINDLTRPDNKFLDDLSDLDIEVVRVPLFFRGGNILSARNRSGEWVTFVGERELKHHQDDSFNAGFFIPKRQTTIGLIQDITGADRVVVLPNGEHTYHLDLVFQFVGDKVVVIEPTDPENLSAGDLDSLEQAKVALLREGFTLVGIPTTSSLVKQFFSPVNAVIYRDKSDEKLHAIVPRRPETGISGGKLSRTIQDAWAEAGVMATLATDRFSTSEGGFHCAFLPLK